MCVRACVWIGGDLNEHEPGELEKIEKMKCGLDMRRCGYQEAKWILGSSAEK